MTTLAETQERQRHNDAIELLADLLPLLDRILEWRDWPFAGPWPKRGHLLALAKRMAELLKAEGLDAS